MVYLPPNGSQSINVDVYGETCETFIQILFLIETLKFSFDKCFNRKTFIDQNIDCCIMSLR